MNTDKNAQTFVKKEVVDLKLSLLKDVIEIETFSNGSYFLGLTLNKQWNLFLRRVEYLKS